MAHFVEYFYSICSIFLIARVRFPAAASGKKNSMTSKATSKSRQKEFADGLRLKPLAPYDFDLSASIFAGGDEHFQAYGGGTFTRVVRTGESAAARSGMALMRVTSTGTIDRPSLAVRLLSDRPLTEAGRRRVRAAAESMLNLQLDLAPFYAAVRGDAVLHRLTRRLRGLKLPVTETPYEALVTSIIEQQISLRVARGMRLRVIRRFGEQLSVDGEEWLAFPTPGMLAVARISELKACGLSTRKAEYIIDVSRRISLGELDLAGLGEMGNEQVVDRLVAVRGIGRWTAEMTMLRGLNRVSVLPADDLGLRRLIGRYYRSGERIDAGEARRIASGWGGWQGLAAFYLVVAWMKGIEP